MKKGFSLLELIFAIVIIGIIASYAIPKYLNTKDHALATTIKRDIVTAISSLQTYYLINRKIEKISDTVTLNELNWEVSDLKITFKDKDGDCVTIQVLDDKIELKVDDTSGNVCERLSEIGIKSQDVDLI